MESNKFSNDEWEAGIVAIDEVLLEDIVTRYEVTVFTLAMHLLSDEELAKQVVLDVFIRFSHEAHHHAAEPLDSVIHRFTYDAALEYLLGKLNRSLDHSLDIGTRVYGERDEKYLVS